MLVISRLMRKKSFSGGFFGYVTDAEFEIMGFKIVRLLKDISKFISRETGSVMMEYIVITAVFMLGVGGVVYFKGDYSNLLPGLLPGQIHSSLTLNDEINLVPVGEAPGVGVNKYGMVGDSFAAQTKKAQQLIAMPLP